MENTTNNNKKLYSIIGAVIVILVIILVVLMATKHGSENVDTNSNDTTTATSTMTSTSTVSVNGNNQAIFAYAVTSPKQTYTQNENIPVIVSILNITNDSQTMSFPNGCQGDYTIGDFDMMAHIRCLPNPTMFTIPAHAVQQVYLVHYPSVYKIPTGTYTLHAGIPGYGGASEDITITK